MDDRVDTNTEPKPERCETCGCTTFNYIEGFGWVCDQVRKTPESSTVATFPAIQPDDEAIMHDLRHYADERTPSTVFYAYVPKELLRHAFYALEKHNGKR